MLLLDEDVNRIVSLGFAESFFASGPDGFKILKNSTEGRCVFHDGNRCTIYENRPAGCKLYPVIFDEDRGSAVKDDLCPYRSEFRISSKSKEKLSSVYSKLMNERLLRIGKNKKRHPNTVANQKL